MFYVYIKFFRSLLEVWCSWAKGATVTIQQSTITIRSWLTTANNSIEGALLDTQRVFLYKDKSMRGVSTAFGTDCCLAGKPSFGFTI